MMRYPRRMFLGQVAAVPFMAGVALAEELNAPLDGRPFLIEALPKPDEVQFSNEVNALIDELPLRLRYRPVSLPAERNAWPLWQEAGNAYIEQPLDDEFQENEERYRQGDQTVPVAVKQQFADWVETNRECRQLVEEGISRGGLEMPRSGASIRLSLMMDEISMLRNLARVVESQSSLCLNRNDVDGAIASASLVMRMGMIQIQAECLFVDLMIAQSILMMGVRAMSRAGAHAAATEAQSITALSHLDDTNWDNGAFEQAVRVELCRWAIPNLAGYREDATPTDLVEWHLLSEFDKDWKPSEQQTNELNRAMRQMAILLEGHPRPFNRLETVRLMGEICCERLDQLDQPWSKPGKRTVLSQIQEELAAWPSQMAPSMLTMAGLPDDDSSPKMDDNEVMRARNAVRKVDNVFGKYIIHECFGSILSGWFLQVSPTHFEAARLRIALSCFERKHSRLPTKLDELVTIGLLNDVPRDSFDGKHFGYSANDRLIWSAGEAGKDKSSAPAWDAETDENFQLAWRIPRR